MFVLTDLQQVVVSIAPVDAMDNPAIVESVVWLSSDPNICTVSPASDGLSATVVTVGPLGACQISVTADAQIGDGEVQLVGTLDISVVASQATTLTVSAGAPTPRP